MRDYFIYDNKFSHNELSTVYASCTMDRSGEQRHGASKVALGSREESILAYHSLA